MADITEKRYYIDAGEGEKRLTCPYSCFEDGRDAKQDIIPPKGYVLKGFIFDPHSPDKDYDGRLIAEYEKIPFSVKLQRNIRKLILLLIGIIIALLILFAVFSKPKPTKKLPIRPLTVVDSSTVDTILKPDSVSTLTIDSISEPKNKTKDESSVAIESENNIEQEKNTVQMPATELPEDANTAQFKQEFWNLVYSRNGQMDSYDALFNKYKGSVKCKEFDYLRGTILENTAAFKSWKSKLLNIPASELQSITTIDALKQKLK